MHDAADVIILDVDLTLVANASNMQVQGGQERQLNFVACQGFCRGIS